MSEVVAVIPARGGSKGIPRKNLARVGGIPLVARAIVTALGTPEIDRVVVSTDDAEIADVAREWGADVIDRPAELAGDQASSESALLHALDVLEDRRVDVGIIAFLQATSPFIDADALGEAVKLVRARRRDTVFSAVDHHGFLWKPGAGGCAEPIGHEAHVRPRRQDREPQLLETGAFYVVRAAGFRMSRHRFFGSIGMVAVAPETAIEIDDPWQLDLARWIAGRIDADTAIDVDAVVTDFDGVHTDDTALVTQTGDEAVRVSRSDGMGVALLRRAGIPMLILSTEQNPVVSARARKLGVDVRQGVDDKATAVREWADAVGVPLSRVAYLGNDVNDLGALEAVGWPAAVQEAHPLVTAAARVVVPARGGDGAVRALAELVLRSRSEEPLAEASVSAVSITERTTR